MDKIFHLEAIEPIDFLGINDENLDTIKKLFPSLKIICRGDKLKVYGEPSDIKIFEKKFTQMMLHLNDYNILSTEDIRHIMDSSPTERKKRLDVILSGSNGRWIKALNNNQQKMVNLIAQNDLVFAIGPAGTGKTYIAVALAVKALKNNQVRRIILSRPAVEADENLGFLPGDFMEKVDPYLKPLYDALLDMLPAKRLFDYLDKETIQIAPLAYMRGRTLENAFVILDEAQNATRKQLKMFLTRMGINAKFIITGDITQIDLPKKSNSGLLEARKILKNIKGIEFLEFDESNIVRNRLVKKIVKAYNSDEKI